MEEKANNNLRLNVILMKFLYVHFQLFVNQTLFLPLKF